MAPKKNVRCENGTSSTLPPSPASSESTITRAYGAASCAGWDALYQEWKPKMYTDYDASFFDDEIAIRRLSLDVPLSLLKLDILVLGALVKFLHPEHSSTMKKFTEASWCVPQLIAIITSTHLEDEDLISDAVAILKEVFLNERNRIGGTEVEKKYIETHEEAKALWHAALRTTNPRVFGACCEAFGEAFLSCEKDPSAGLEFAEALCKKWHELRSI